MSHIIQLFPARRAAANIPVAYVEDNLLISYLLTVVIGEYDSLCWMDLYICPPELLQSDNSSSKLLSST